MEAETGRQRGRRTSVEKWLVPYTHVFFYCVVAMAFLFMSNSPDIPRIIFPRIIREACMESLDSVLYPVSHRFYTAPNATYLHRRSADEKFPCDHPVDTRTGLREMPEEASSAS